MYSKIAVEHISKVFYTVLYIFNDNSPPGANTSPHGYF